MRTMTERTLKDIHTQQMLTYLDYARRVAFTHNYYDVEPTFTDDTKFFNISVYEPGFGDCTWLSINDIKNELNTREHIPNKQEAKLIRQQKAKAKRNR